MTEEQANDFFTPSRQEQVAATLAGQCPHNRGWYYVGHGHNEEAWKCTLCDEIKWY